VGVAILIFKAKAFSFYTIRMEWRLFLAFLLLLLLLTAVCILAYKIDHTSLTITDASGSTITAHTNLGYY
jgi:hypothetical protein